MALASVAIDQREPDFIKQLAFGGVPKVESLLDSGDILCACTDGSLLAIERKTSDDLLNSLRDDRLFVQIAKLREISPFAYLIITGDLRPGPNGLCWSNHRQTAWNWSSVSGALLTIQELGVHIVQCPSDTEYEATVIRLGNRDRQILKVQPARDATIITEAETILCSLPGIGIERAQALLKFCGSVAWTLNYLTDLDSVEGVPGIGNSIKRRVRRALGLPDWAELCVIQRDTHEKVQQESAA